jgi:hypothetical protein
MKKKKPLLIILAFIFLILVILLIFFSNKKGGEGEEGGSAIKKFFTFGSRTDQTGTGNETAGGDLLNGGINPLTGREYTDEELRLLRQEQERANRERATTFTGQQPIDPFNTNGNENGGGNNGGGNNGGYTGTGNFGNSGGSGSGNGNTGGGSSSTTTRPPTTTPTGPVCSDTDLYITFTEEEKAQIAKLQQRFSAISENLVSDQDVQTEENNYSGFKIKTERFAELTLMCEDTITKAAGNAFSTLRVPTPFWKDSRSLPSFIAKHIQRTMKNIPRPGRQDDPLCNDPNGNFLTDNLCTIDTYVYKLPLIDAAVEKTDIDGYGTPFNWFEIFYRLYIW